MVELLVGMRPVKNRAGYTMVGTSKLFGPCSMTRIESLGSASASRAAMTQAAVPPMVVY